MPYMRGPAPIRRTLRYLEAGKIVFRNNVKIFTINYNSKGDHHLGTKDFVFWHLPQLLYKNPQVQILSFVNLTPTPFTRTWLEDGNDIIMDLDGKSKEDVFEHIKKILGKSDMQLKMEAFRQEDNPAYFGRTCKRHCICEIPGQVPCPEVVPLPTRMRGKYWNATEEELAALS